MAPNDKAVLGPLSLKKSTIYPISGFFVCGQNLLNSFGLGRILPDTY